MKSTIPKKNQVTTELSPAEIRQIKCDEILGNYVHNRAERTPLPTIKVNRDSQTGMINLELPRDASTYVIAKSILSLACGTTHSDLWKLILSQGILSLQPARGEEQDVLNALVAFLLEVQPQDPIEAMLTTQIFVTQSLALRRSSLIHSEGQTVQGANLRINQIAKLLGLSLRQTEVLDKYRNRNKPQVVRVEKVEIRDQAQAIVASYMERGEGKSGQK